MVDRNLVGRCGLYCGACGIYRTCKLSDKKEKTEAKNTGKARSF